MAGRSHIPRNNDNAREEKERKNRRRREIDDIRVVLQSPEGRRLLKRIATFGHVFLDNLATNAKVYAIEGQRQMAHVFLRDAEIADRGFTSELMAETIAHEIDFYEKEL